MQAPNQISEIYYSVLANFKDLVGAFWLSIRFLDLLASASLGFPSWCRFSWAPIVIGVPAVIVSLGDLDSLRALSLEPSFSPLWVRRGGGVRRCSDVGGFSLATLLPSMLVPLPLP